MADQIATTSSVINTDVDYLSDLIEDCLIKIFDGLNMEDLMKMCLIKERFRHIIVWNIIGHRTLDLMQIAKTYPLEEVFEFFGPGIKKMKIRAKIITLKIFQLIVKFCRAERLTELELNISMCKPTILRQLVLLPHNLCKLTLVCGNKTKMLLNEVSDILRNNNNLKVLNIKCFSLMDFNGLALPLNLNELTIDECNDIDLDMLKNYFIRNPNLKKFGYKASKSLDLFLMGRLQPPFKILEIIAEFLPNLEALLFEADSKLGYEDNAKSVLILSLRQLKRLEITSHSVDCEDLYKFLRKLAIQNTLEELTITIKRRYGSFIYAYWTDDFPVFSSLQSLEVVKPERHTEYFLTNFVQKTTNLTKCVFRSTLPIPSSVIYKTAILAQELTTLCIKAPRTSIYKLYINLCTKFKESKTSPCELRIDGKSSEFFGSKNSFYDPSVLKITYPKEE